MASRTLEGKHSTRFIIEVKGSDGEGKMSWQRSRNFGLQGFFSTRAEATTALAAGDQSDGMKYRVRQK
jgi:hypothetical protein